MSLYCTYLTNYTDIQSTTLRSYVSAIKAKLQTIDYKWNQEQICLSSLIKSCKIKNDCVKLRLPIGRNLLDCTLFEVERRFLILENNPYKSTMFKTAFIFGYYGLMQVGEIALSEHTVKAKDVHLSSDKTKLLIILHSSKNPYSDSVTATNKDIK